MRGGIVLAFLLVAATARADSELEQLHRQARVAAQHGNCSARDFLVERIDHIDHAYRTSQIDTDALVTTCTPGVSNFVAPATPQETPPAPATPSGPSWKDHVYFDFTLMAGYRTYVIGTRNEVVDARYAFGLRGDVGGGAVGAGVVASILGLGLEARYQHPFVGDWKWIARGGLVSNNGPGGYVGVDLARPPFLAAVETFYADHREGVLVGLGLSGKYGVVVGTVIAVAAVAVFIAALHDSNIES